MEIQRITAGKPFSFVGIDIAGPLLRPDKGNRYLIVGTDYLTRQVETKTLKRKSSLEIAKFLIEEVFVRHGALTDYYQIKEKNLRINISKKYAKL